MVFNEYTYSIHANFTMYTTNLYHKNMYT